MRGVVIVDKPPGLTSGQVVFGVKDILNIKKAGHTGTLDPNATGFLLVALGEAVKAMPVLMALPKEYRGTVHLHGDVSKEKIKNAFKQFEGKIIQTPPVRSAVARKPRQREVYSLRILRTTGRDVEFRVRCQAGVYIRKLAHSLGQTLGCGAHLKKLRRTKVGRFSGGVKLEKLGSKDIIPLEKALKKAGLKKITVKTPAVQKIKNGSPVMADWVIKADKGIKNGETVGIFTTKNKIIALARFLELELPSLHWVQKRRWRMCSLLQKAGEQKPPDAVNKHIIVAKTDRVFKD